MNIFNIASKLPDGIAHMTEMFGPDGIVADPEIAEARSEVCNTCAKNQHGVRLSHPVALAVKKFLEFRKDLNLSTTNDDNLGRCGVCECELKLLVHVPQERVREYMTDEEEQNSPAFCWKLK